MTTFWKSLDIPDNLLSLFEEVDPRWDAANKRLLVQSGLQRDPECWHKVSMVVLVCRRWINWSDTRWARFGRAGKLYVRSLCTGIDASVQQCLADPSCSSYHLTGYSRASSEVRFLLSISAFSAAPCEYFVLQMLIDDRLLRRAPELHSGVLERLRIIAEMPEEVWSRVASMLDRSMHSFRHAVMLSACIAYGYLVRDVFTHVWTEPLSLTQGDIEANVAGLAIRMEPIRDERVQRMKNLLDAGTAQGALVEGLRLLRDVPGSTALVEEGHASGSILMKNHERCS